MLNGREKICQKNEVRTFGRSGRVEISSFPASFNFNFNFSVKDLTFCNSGEDFPASFNFLIDSGYFCSNRDGDQVQSDRIQLPKFYVFPIQSDSQCADYSSIKPIYPLLLQWVCKWIFYSSIFCRYSNWNMTEGRGDKTVQDANWRNYVSLWNVCRPYWTTTFLFADLNILFWLTLDPSTSLKFSWDFKWLVMASSHTIAKLDSVDWKWVKIYFTEQRGVHVHI